MSKEITIEVKNELFTILKRRIEQNNFKNVKWSDIQEKLENNPSKLWSLYQMEITEGEPNIVDFDEKTNEYIFIDCSIESPAGRRSLCYDRKALDARKANKPKNSAIDLANDMGIALLTEEKYTKFHEIIKFDKKTSSWVLTPEELRNLGGALFCDFRFGRVFTYHNGAESYYAARGFRGMLRI